jgi:phage recombination protein Bet
VSEQSTAMTAPKIGDERLPYHPAVEQKFGIDRGAWRALVDAIFPTASTVEGVILALSYCKARNLDVFKRPVHIVPIWNKDQRRLVDTVWPGIGELRTTAARTGQYVGRDAVEWGPMIEQVLSGVTMQFPEWARITVYRMMGGQRVPFVGPQVYWLETYATAKHDSDSPNSMWRDRPRGQLEKCAEAAALRVAFPEEVGSDYTDDEVRVRVRDEVELTGKAKPMSISKGLRESARVVDAQFTESAGPAQNTGVDASATSPSGGDATDSTSARERQKPTPTNSSPSPTQAAGAAPTASAPASGRPKAKAKVEHCSDCGMEMKAGKCPNEKNHGVEQDTSTSGQGAVGSNAEGQTSSGAAGNSVTDGPSDASTAPGAEDFPDDPPEPKPEPVKLDPKAFRAQCREKAIAEVAKMKPEDIDALVGMTAESEDPRIHKIWVETKATMQLSGDAKPGDLLGPMKKKAAQYIVLYGLLTPAK